MKKILLIILFLSNTIISCQNIEKDDSKMLKEYYELGIKSINENWTNLDLENSLKTLLKLKENRPNSMPKFGSEKSGKLLHKIFSSLPLVYEKAPNNLKKFSKEAKLSRKLLFDLLNIYESTENINYPKEEAEVYKYHILVSTHKAITYLDFMSRISEKDRIEEKSSIKKFKKGIVNSFIPVMNLIERGTTFQKENRIDISNFLSGMLMKIWNLLDSKHHIELRKKINEIISNSNNKKIELIFQNLNNELKN
jgi:hypothetical protein